MPDGEPTQASPPSPPYPPYAPFPPYPPYPPYPPIIIQCCCYGAPAGASLGRQPAPSEFVQPSVASAGPPDTYMGDTRGGSTSGGAVAGGPVLEGSSSGASGASGAGASNVGTNPKKGSAPPAFNPLDPIGSARRMAEWLAAQAGF